jgi:hypothetical protein
MIVIPVSLWLLVRCLTFCLEAAAWSVPAALAARTDVTLSLSYFYPVPVLWLAVRSSDCVPYFVYWTWFDAGLRGTRAADIKLLRCNLIRSSRYSSPIRKVLKLDDQPPVAIRLIVRI